MSRDERFFNPKVLRRVAQAVEWEGNLRAYKNGRTNQGEYMAALGILWGRWMFEDRFDEAWSAAKQFLARDWASMFRDVLRGMPSKIEQLAGFYRGTFGGILKTVVSSRQLPARFVADSSSNLAPADREVAAALGELFAELARIVEEVKHG